MWPVVHRQPDSNPFLEFGKNEPIDCSPRPVAIPDIWEWRFLGLLIGPMLSATFNISTFGRRTPDSRTIRTWRPHTDPFGQGSHFVIGQLPGGRHLQLGILVRDGLDQQRLFRFASHQCRTARASLLQTLRRIDSQASPLNLFTMTGVTSLHENRADPLFEELRVLRISAPLASEVSSPNHKIRPASKNKWSHVRKYIKDSHLPSSDSNLDGDQLNGDGCSHIHKAPG